MVKTKKIQIKDLVVGMQIKTKNDQGDIVFKTVTDKWDTVVTPEDQARLEFENGVIVNCSVNHPIMVWNDDCQLVQKKPRELTVDDLIVTEEGTTRLKVADFGQQNDTGYIDITVEDTHTFFASSSNDGPMVLTHNSQGGIRNASATVFYPIWHYQFDDLIVLKNNQGTDETRVRHLDYGVVLSAFFWRRFKNKGNITFFDPNEVPDLYEAFYQDSALFEEMYTKYEKRKDLRTKSMSAEEVFLSGILKERTDTGRIYIVNIDNIQAQGPFDPSVDPIYQSNLCCITGDMTVEFMHQSGTIEEMSAGDAVERFELGGLTDSKIKSFEDGKVVWKSISTAVKTKTVSELYVIEDEHSNVLSCTDDHRVYTVNRGYVRADELVETDLLQSGYIGNEHVSIVTISKVIVEPTDVYDFTVPGTECFFANDILVHNCEITLPTRPFKSMDDPDGRVALCTLGSISWGAFRNPEDMRRACRTLIRGLNNILDYQDFLSIQSKLSNEEIRPLGIGITNLAYWHAKRGLKYGEPEALAEVKRWMEHQAYYLTEATVELAKERGACLHSSTTRYGQGIFPWELRADGVNELTDFTPELDWEPLRAEMIKYGVRNATLMAIAPVESSSVVLNSTNGIEMPMQLIQVKESKAGSVVQVVPEYNRLKNKYQLMWDQPNCIEYLKTSAVLAAYVDQSISANTFWNPANYPDGKIPVTEVAKASMLYHKWGGKTQYYSITNKKGFKSESEETNTPVIETDDGDCESCKL